MEKIIIGQTKSRRKKLVEKMFCGCLRKLLLRDVGWSGHRNALPHPLARPLAHPLAHPPLSQKSMAPTDTLGLQMITSNQYALLLFFDSLAVESLSLSRSLALFLLTLKTHTHTHTPALTHTHLAIILSISLSLNQLIQI